MRYHNDPEAAAVRMREWRAKNPSLQKKIERRYREKHSVELSERHKQWREKNYEKVLADGKAKHAKNRDRANSIRSQRRSANLEAERTRQRDSHYSARVVAPWIRLVSAAKFRAKKYELPFNLTVEWARLRWTGACELTGIPFRSDERGSGPKTYAASIDQIRARKGYTQYNCRFVLWAVNALKHDGDDADMYLIASALLNTKYSDE